MSSEPNDSEQIVAPAHIPPLPTPSTMLAESEPLARHFGPNTRILLICHAEGMHNRYRDLMANALTEESGLTAVGWKQADMLAAWLQKYETIDVLVSGGQLHSRLTSQRIGQALGLPVSVARDLPGLWGEDQELPQQDVEPDELDPEIHTSTHNVVARPYVEFHHALITTLIKIVQQNRNKTIAMVTSSGAIATIIRHFFGAHKLQVQVDHTSISEIDHRNGQWRLFYVNRREHLPRPEVTKAGQSEKPLLPPEENEDISLIAEVYNAAADNILERYRMATAANEQRRIQHFVKFANIPPGKRILEVGSGLGILSLALAAGGAEEVIGVDVSLGMLEHAEYIRLSNPSAITPKVNFRLAPAQMLPFRSDTFDAVVCRLVLHHSRVPERILQEMVRVLKPDGIFAFADLVGSEHPVKRATFNAIEARRNPSHVTTRTIDQYQTLIQGAHLTIEAEEMVTFERDLENWLAELQSDPADWQPVREMIEAAMETDAAGINARRRGDRVAFDQNVLYVRAIKQ